MGVLKEFVCFAHGEFEEFVNGDELPSCPKGCSNNFVAREIRTTPGLHNAKTKNIDGILKDFAAQHNLPDIRVDKDDDKSVMQNLRARDGNNRDEFAAYWASTDKINTKEFKPTNVFNKDNVPAVRPDILDGKVRGSLPKVDL